MSEETSVEILPPDVETQLQANGVPYVAVMTKAGPCAFRGLKRQEYQRFNSMARDPKGRDGAIEFICGATLLYPNAAEFQAYLNRYPLIVVKCSDEVLEFSGLDQEAATKNFEG